MLVAIILAVIGIMSVITITQVLGYRLGGVIVVPIMAVYTLKNFVMFPVFLISALIAYMGLNYVKRKTMIYGRAELVASILINSVLQVIGLFFMRSSGVEFQNIFFIGSLLPGLAGVDAHLEVNLASILGLDRAFSDKAFSDKAFLDKSFSDKSFFQNSTPGRSNLLHTRRTFQHFNTSTLKH
jgi:hypothetical protein